MMTNERSGASLAHFQIIRRMSVQPAAQAVGAPMLSAGSSPFISTVGALLRLIPVLLCTMAQRVTGVLVFRNCSAPPGRTQEPPRPMVPPRWCCRGSVLAVPRVAEGGAA